LCTFGIELKGKVFRGNGIAKSKLTHITMIKIVMLMRYFGAGIVFMMAFFLRKLLLKMAKTIYGLKYY
jgi:hypothetical protein